MSHNTTCLNCTEPVSQKFCPNCGQKCDTHRITFKHLVFHDIIHGIWHFEKGILFTIKEALTRPGKAALDYIAGKRIRYYNVFYLALLLIGLNLFLVHFYDTHAAEFIKTEKVVKNIQGKQLDQFFDNYEKLLLIGLLPLFAINSFILFRKKKLNFSEHVIVSGIIYLGILIISLSLNVFIFFDFTKNFVFLSDASDFIAPFLLVSYVIFAYYNAFGTSYKKMSFIFKMLFFIVLLFVEVVTFMLCVKAFLRS